MCNNTRLAKFESFASHPWLRKSWARLRAEEREIARTFLVENASLDRAAFERRLNRMFLDQPTKPKHFTTILELLTNANVP
jgi:hypothetical protein